MTKSKHLKILFLDILTDDKKAKARIRRDMYRGKTYAKYVEGLLGARRVAVYDVDGAHGKLPDPRDFDAIIMGGSRHNPVEGEEKPWILKIYTFIKSAARHNIPLLGICGGLQFTVRALGGEIIYNPKGREFVTTPIALSDSGAHDPIFKGISRHTKVQETHRCMAKKLKPGWKLLASSNLCKIQAIAIGDNIRLLQFHPEMNTLQMKALARTRKLTFIEEGFVEDNEGFDLLLKSLTRTDKAGTRILKNFITYFVVPYHAKRSAR